MKYQVLRNQVRVTAEQFALGQMCILFAIKSGDNRFNGHIDELNDAYREIGKIKDYMKRNPENVIELVNTKRVVTEFEPFATSGHL